MEIKVQPRPMEKEVPKLEEGLKCCQEIRPAPLGLVFLLWKGSAEIPKSPWQQAGEAKCQGQSAHRR